MNALRNNNSAKHIIPQIGTKTFVKKEMEMFCFLSFILLVLLQLVILTMVAAAARETIMMMMEKLLPCTMQNAISINNYTNSQASKQSSTTAFGKLE